MTQLFQLISAVSTVWAAAGELLTAGAILMALNTAANLIRLTYQAGQATGRVLWPVIHAVVACIRWMHREIDWGMVALVVRDGLVAVVALAWLAGVEMHRTVIALSEQLGHRYAAIVATPDPVITVAPMVHPLALVADELEQLTCRQLQQLIGTRRRVRKAELIAMAIA